MLYLNFIGRMSLIKISKIISFNFRSKPLLERETSVTGSESAPSITGSTVNFDIVQEHYQALKLAANEEHFS